MVKGFSKRKIETEVTLGEFLKKARESRNLPLEEAEIGSKVKAKYLVALEKDDWRDLPSSVYVRGFILAYSKFLELNRIETLRLFDREAKLYKKDHQNSLSYKKSVKDLRIILTPKLLGYVSAFALVIFLFGYIIYEVQGFAGTPSLKVNTPNNNEITDHDSIEVTGIADIDAVLKINQETIPITNDGRFSSDMKLHQGVNVISVEAVSKANKETSQVLTIEYKPKTAANFQTSPEN